MYLSYALTAYAILPGPGYKVTEGKKYLLITLETIATWCLQKLDPISPHIWFQALARGAILYCLQYNIPLGFHTFLGKCRHK